MFPLLLATACLDYRISPPPRPPTGGLDSGLDESPSSACALAVVPSVLVEIDATCRAPALDIVDPFDIVVQAEVDGEQPVVSEADTPQPIIADVDGDGSSEIAIPWCDDETDACDVTVFSADGSIAQVLPPTNHSAPLAAVDVDGLAGAELIVGRCTPAPDHSPCEDPTLDAMRWDGSVVWSIPGDFTIPVAVADLYADGTPEFVYGWTLYDIATGERTGVLEDRTGGRGSATADVDHDATLEIASSDALYHAAGDRIWQAEGQLASHPVALQADADPEPEFLFRYNGFGLVDSDGTLLSSVDVDLSWSEGVVADLDGDGFADVVAVTQGGSLTVFHLDGSVLWTRDDVLYPSGIFGWDIDSDGAAELIVQTRYDVYGASPSEDALIILDGATGAELFSTPIRTNDPWTPLVADLDGDGHAELVVSGGTPHADGTVALATIFHQRDDTWPAAGRAWPIPDFHISDIGPAGEIPRGETDPPAWTYSVYHARPAVDGQGVNLAATLVDTCYDGDVVQVEVTVANTGPRPAANVVVRALAGFLPVGEATNARVGPGEVSAGVLLELAPGAFNLGEIRVVVDPDDAFPECDEGDNQVVVPDPR